MRKHHSSTDFSRGVPLHWWILCSLIVLALIAVLRNSFSIASSTASVNDFYKNYRRLREQAASDFLEIRALAMGTNQQKELDLCNREMDNYVPCYNVSANMLAGFHSGEEFDRHCEVSGAGRHCLVRPPKDYKIPMRWPGGRDVIWSGNVKITKDQFLSSGTMTKRLMLLEENQIAFHSEDGMNIDGVKDYSHQVAEMIGLGSDSEFLKAGGAKALSARTDEGWVHIGDNSSLFCTDSANHGVSQSFFEDKKVRSGFKNGRAYLKVRTILDIECGFGSFGAHLFSLNLMTICIAAYEVFGSQVQLALERGLPAMIGSFTSKQLPYPSLSFDMVHCAQCGITWDAKDGAFLIEVDRVLKPGGYFVLTSPTSKPLAALANGKSGIMFTTVEDFTQKICWNLLAQQDETFIWQKTADVNCYASRKQGAVPVPLCNNENDVESYYQPLVSCISGTTSKRWIPMQNRSYSPADFQLSFDKLAVHEIHPDDFQEDSHVWSLALKNYWSLLTPLIFSDHPKRPGDEDPLPPFNMIRNVMDMNAHYGGLNAAFLVEKKSVWVMNVVPLKIPNTLPLILDRGFAGVLHDWCEPFPTYPRTYDMLHAAGILSQILDSGACDIMRIFLEMDRILRPEGWVILRDEAQVIKKARIFAQENRWDARVIELQNENDQRLLVCQKPFLKK